MRTESVLKNRFQDRKRASLEVSEALKVLILKGFRTDISCPQLKNSWTKCGQIHVLWK